MKKFNLISILLFFLILQDVKAISLGSVIKKDFVSIKANESAKFEILFWNVEEEPYEIELEVEEAPKDWFIAIQPKKFLLSSSIGEEYISLPYLENPVKVFVVKIFVKPENSAPGEYKILIRAKAGTPTQNITFFQEREFKLRVKIEGEKIEEENRSLTVPKEEFPFIGRAIEQTSHVLSYILTIICILVISALIYKYA